MTAMLAGQLKRIGMTEAQVAPSRSLLNRFGQPVEVAQANLWLASDASTFVTGTTIHVNAGYVEAPPVLQIG